MQAAELPGASAESEDRIGFLFAVLGRQSDAIGHFEKSLSLSRSYAPALPSWCCAVARKGC
jgi:hypothetical protein